MSWIQTYTGRKFHPGKPQTWDFSIVDIAHALSHMPRFAGHTERLYSVAQHSVMVSEIMEDYSHGFNGCLEGLLHDATEAYLMDLPMPIKSLPELERYRQLEAAIDGAIMLDFGVKERFPKTVKGADLQALATEARDLMDAPEDWESIKNIPPLADKIVIMSPQEAKIAFLERYIYLSEKDWAKG